MAYGCVTGNYIQVSKEERVVFFSGGAEGQQNRIEEEV